MLCRGSCTIDDTDSVILTGGFEGENKEEGIVLKRVSRYNLAGLLEELPEMMSGRAEHACARYNDGGSKVQSGALSLVQILQILCSDWLNLTTMLAPRSVP